MAFTLRFPLNNNIPWFADFAKSVADAINGRRNEPFKLASYIVAEAPAASAANEGGLIYVSDEAGGATIAFSDGTDWRRVQDRAVVS